MKASRGFVIPPLIMQVLPYVLLALAVAAAYQWVNHTWETEAGLKAGREAGTKATAARYDERDRQAKEKYDRELAALRERNAKLESANLAALQANAAAYQKGLTDGKADLDRRVADVHRGYRLRDAGGTSSCPAPREPGGSATATASATGRGPDGSPPGQLSAAAGCTLSARTSEGLIRLASDADDAARQVSGLQAEVLRIYNLCTGGP